MKKLFKVSFLLCTVIVLLFGITIVSSADAKNITGSEASCCNFAAGASSYLLSTKAHFSYSENIEVTFGIDSNHSITRIEHISSGATVINTSISEDMQSFTLELENEQITVDQVNEIRIILQNDDEIYSNLYIHNNQYGAFISPFSYDDAREIFYEYAVSSEILTEYECQELRNNTNINGISVSTSVQPINNTYSVNSEKIFISGHLQWQDDFGYIHDLRCVRVAVVDKRPISTRILCEGYTDNDGDYSISFQPDDGYEYGTDVALRIYASTPGGTVYVGGSSTESFVDISILSDIYLHNMISRNLTFDMGTDHGRRLQISQAILTGYDFAREMMGDNPPSVFVKYPYNDNAYYYVSSYKIEITGSDGSHDELESYSSWDMILHEYGHHIEYQLDIINSPGGTHHIDENLADTNNNKSHGIRLAWAESWATVFGIMAQHHQSEYLTNIRSVYDESTGEIDTLCESYNSSAFDIEYTSTLIGDACEESIIGVLWDIFDNVSDSNDMISLGYESFWDVTTSSGATTFSEFVEYFYEEYPDEIFDLGKNLTYYKMATSIPFVARHTLTSSTPQISWDAQGGSVEYPNNQFQVIFYDHYFNEILRTPVTTASSYTLTQDEWDKVLYTDYTNYYVVVSAIQTDYPTTGEYISAIKEMVKPVEMSLSDSLAIVADNKYTETVIKLLPGQHIELSISCGSTKTRIIQTFGSENVKMILYHPTLNMVWRESTGGGFAQNAFLRVSLTQQTVYRLRIELEDENAAGIFKLAITPARAYANASSSGINSYTDIYSCANGTEFEVGFITETCETEVITFTPPVSGVYSFEIQTTQFYSYIHIIDPRSKDPLIYGVDHIGASGGAKNVYIEKELDAGVPYLIILSPYSPEATVSNLLGVLYINKED